MRALKLFIGLLIPASLLMVSWVIVEEPCLTCTINTLGRTLLVQAGFCTSDSMDEEQQTPSTSIADVSPLHSVSAVSSELPSLNDPYVNEQWALSQVQAPALWQITMGNPEILVAVLDTGIDQNHEDLNGKVVAEVNFTDSPTSDDIHGHGTHVAGIIVANSNNEIGIAGFAPESRLMNVKVADDEGRCQAAVIAKGIIWAVDNGASVINISLELKEPSSELEDAINYAWNRGAIVMVAAGNNGSDLPVYPAYYENSVAVAAIRQNDTLAPLSNHGDWVDVAAPGFNIYSTLPGDGYGYKSGTSFATAYASGLAALLFSVVTDTNNNGRVNDEVRAALEAGCHEISAKGVGAGRIGAINSLIQMGYIS